MLNLLAKNENKAGFIIIMKSKLGFRFSVCDELSVSIHIWYSYSAYPPFT